MEEIQLALAASFFANAENSALVSPPPVEARDVMVFTNLHVPGTNVQLPIPTPAWNCDNRLESP